MVASYVCALKMSHYGCAGTHGKHVHIIHCHDAFILSPISKKITKLFKAIIGLLTNGK